MPESTSQIPRCYDCRFYSPGDFGCPLGHEEYEIPEGGDDCLPGVCRRRPPHLGRLVPDKDDVWRTYGEWPKVMACDWCGEFERRSVPLPDGT